MSAYLKRLNIDSVLEVGEETTNSAYLKRVEIVEVVDQDGNPWEPVPGPDPWDALVVGHKATWSGDNVYAVGEDISGTSATFVGGTDQVVYRSRVQHKSVTDSSWNNSPWTNHTNTPQVIHFDIPAGEENGEVRFQTQARDEGVDPVEQVNSFASVKDIAPAEWGTVSVTIDDNAYDGVSYSGAANTPFHCVVSFTGNVDDVTYLWSQRGTDPVLIGTPTNHTTTITFPQAGVFSVTAELKSPKTEEWYSAIITFIVA